MLPDTQERVYGWLQHNLLDLLSIKDALASGADPDSIWRDRPLLAIAVGQQELREPARGRVWDCRPEVRVQHAG